MKKLAFLSRKFSCLFSFFCMLRDALELGSRVVGLPEGYPLATTYGPYQHSYGPYKLLKKSRFGGNQKFKKAPRPPPGGGGEGEKKHPTKRPSMPPLKDGPS